MDISRRNDLVKLRVHGGIRAGVSAVHACDSGFVSGMRMW